MNKTEIEKLARWYNTLNSWEWPDDLGGKPDGWDDMTDIFVGEFSPNKFSWSRGIMDEIVRLISWKECIRWHHIHNLKSSNDAFEIWWKEHYGQ